MLLPCIRAESGRLHADGVLIPGDRATVIVKVVRHRRSPLADSLKRLSKLSLSYSMLTFNNTLLIHVFFCQDNWVLKLPRQSEHYQVHCLMVHFSYLKVDCTGYCCVLFGLICVLILSDT